MRDMLEDRVMTKVLHEQKVVNWLVAEGIDAKKETL